MYKCYGPAYGLSEDVFAKLTESGETREVAYICKYASGHLTLIQSWS